MSDSTANNAYTAIEQQRQTRRLPVRLKREQPWGRAVGCALFIGVLLSAIAGGAALVVRNVPDAQKDKWAVYVFIGVFGLVGLAMLAAGVHQWFASRVHETIVEIDLEQIRRGGNAQVCFRQEGPVTLNSLRANVRCVERKHHWKTRSGSDGGSETYKTTDEKDLWTQNILDEEPGRVQAEEFWEKSISFTVPNDYPASLTTDNLEIVWKIEVWGRVHLWPDFMHPFVIQVV